MKARREVLGRLQTQVCDCLYLQYVLYLVTLTRVLCDISDFSLLLICQASDTVKIPREYHRFILGKNGKKLQQLEYETATKITIPRADEKLDGIKIVGPKEGIERARHEIQIIADEQVCFM